MLTGVNFIDNTLKDKLRAFVPYFVITIFCLLANIVYLQYILKYQKEKERVELRAYSQEIGSNLANDFKNALQGNRGGFAFFLLFNNITNSQLKEAYIDLNKDNIYVITPSRVVVFNKEAFIKFVSNLLPDYIDYQVSLNEINILQNRPSKEVIDLQKKYGINKNYEITLKIKIDQDHKSYVVKRKKPYIDALISLVISLVSAIILLHLYLMQYHRLRVSEKQKEAVFLQQKAERSLRKLFIRNATAVYLDNNIPNMSPEQKRVNELSNFLFPIAFTEPANDEEIDVKEVIKDLTNYTAFEATKYDIKFDKQVDILKVQCSSVVFYQILFSLVSNLILLMPPVSDTPALDKPKKKFTVTFLEEKVIIDFETFPLNAEQIAGFADKKIPIDTFFLDYKRVLESLKSHNIGYSVIPGKVSNRFELDFKKKTPKGKPKLRLVE